MSAKFIVDQSRLGLRKSVTMTSCTVALAGGRFSKATLYGIASLPGTSFAGPTPVGPTFSLGSTGTSKSPLSSETGLGPVGVQSPHGRSGLQFGDWGSQGGVQPLGGLEPASGP